jgi:hypothetical protein
MSNRFSDDDNYYDTEEEDEEWNAPITASWGVPSTEQDEETSNGGSTDVAGWHQLTDPNAKLRADGVGAGNLHRQGKNFKPVDEQMILNQRLGKPLPKKAGSKAKQISVPKKSTKVSIQPIAGNKAPHHVSVPGMGKKAAKKARQASVAAAAERARAHVKAAEVKGGSSHTHEPPVRSVWTTGASLVTTPFWEQSSSRSSMHATHQQQQPPQQQQRPEQPPRQPSKQQSAYQQQQHQHRPPAAAAAPPAAKPAAPPAPVSAPKLGMQIKGLSESMRKIEIAKSSTGSSAFQHQPQTKISTSGRTVEVYPMKQQQQPQSQHQQQPSQYAPPANRQKAAPINTTVYPPKSTSSNASMYAPENGASNTSMYASQNSSSNASKYAPQADAPASIPTSSKRPTTSADSRWATPSAANNILFTLNIELERGETMPITVRAKDDPAQLALAFVERFQQRSGNSANTDNSNVVQALTRLIQQQIETRTAKT